MKKNSLYQYGTLALLVPGLFKGTASLNDILNHGDTGIGTGEGLDGELIIINGTTYQVNGDGDVNKLNDNFKLPFADVHYADFNNLFTVNNETSASQLYEQILKSNKTNNIFIAVKIHGIFSFMKTRAVKKQEEPYTTLENSAKDQSIFTKNNVEGTIIGYYAPELFNGPAVGGFHTHFLADDLSMGGHILDFKMESGYVNGQKLYKLEQDLPKDEEYLNHDFSNDDIEDAIGKAEK
ncbi:acetolactate decarboxylase [Lactobacillus sp. S2-2]|uniref:acetolactate decarboxylase n=1 Tax=Lactobacillus sp. S2-2 TaxID=2692917 RepID=UPI001F02647F|nr:acetolactate decarboxylase [Lactobacillus sp. S2-2]MCF6515423.1 acetolactate decarboxylase [Lactobacillus sp. S2-2]